MASAAPADRRRLPQKDPSEKATVGLGQFALASLDIKQAGAGATDLDRLTNQPYVKVHIKGLVNERVAVRGEIEEYLGPGSFVLESGGIFDDEITVVVPQDVKGLDPVMLREDNDVVVSGMVRAMSKIDIERELG
jgi:hypothetical protein